MFPQGRHAQREGTARGLARDGAPCVSYSEHCARYRYNAMRSRQIFEIWTEVFGSTARAARLKFVIGTQVGGGAEITRELLSWNNTHLYVDFLGVTGYMGAADTIDAGWAIRSVSDVHASMKSAVQAHKDQHSLHVAAAAESNVKTITYEGGPGLVEDGVIGGGTPTGSVTELLIAANRHEGMSGVVTEYLDAYKSIDLFDASDRPFMYFTGPSGFYSKYGSWGMTEYADQPWAEAPKLRAAQAYIDTYLGAPPACLSAAAAAHAGGGIGMTAPNSFHGPPAVTAPLRNDTLVIGERYRVTWDGARAPPAASVALHLWKGTSCAGEPAAVIAASVSQTAGETRQHVVEPSVRRPISTYSRQYVDPSGELGGSGRLGSRRGLLRGGGQGRERPAASQPQLQRSVLGPVP
eukprot:8050685-Pyramimonas_sp.AAC.2